MPESSLHTLAVEGLTTDLRLRSFEGQEGLSQLFEFAVTVSSESTIDFGDVVRKKATLTIHLEDDAEPRLVHGIVSRVEEEDARAKWSQYRITLVPWPWLLLHRVDSRIFQAMTVPQIVKNVLDGAGYASGTDYKISVQGTYATREYCVQYRESDWDFVCRLLEEEGIHYRFDQTEETHVLVMADTASAYPSIPGDATLVYRPAEGALAALMRGNHVSSLHQANEVRSGKTTLRDWNFEKPALLLESKAAGKTDTDLEVYDYPGEYDAASAGDGLAQVRLGEQGPGRLTGSGDSRCTRLAPGYTFTLSEHSRDALNTNYLLTGVAHWGTEPQEVSSADGGNALYGNKFTVVLATDLFRPPRVTPRPHIAGVQTAIVVGASGDEICVDEHARVKVQFHWDRLGKNDDKSSCWVRVAQPWASSAFGAVFIPRVKDEVVVTFLEGDPDRPLVVGSVYHGTNVPPYSLPSDKTRSTIKSRSTPNGGAEDFNELRFEDKKGSEEVFLQAQKDWTIAVKNDKNQKVGHDETLEVGNDRTKTVKHDQTGTVDHDDTLTVKNNQTMTVQNDQSLTVQNDRSVTVQNDHTESVSGNQSITVSKAQTLSISDKQDITVSKKRSLTVNDDVTETFTAKLTVSVTGEVSETMKDKRTVQVTGDHAETIGGKEAIKISGDSVETVGGKKTFTVTGDVTITAGASTVTIKPSGEITISGVQMKIDASGPLQIHGATVDVKSDGPASISAPVVKTSADGVNTLKGAMVVVDAQMVSLG